MAGVLVLALTWVIAAPDSATRCSLFQQRSMRPRGIVELTLRATRDSVRDGYRPAAGANETRHRARLAWDTAAIYAQVFELVRAEGDLGSLQPRRGRRVALVWWRSGQQCQRITPEPAVRSDVDDLFLLARRADSSVPDTGWFDAVYTDLRPERQWIQGMPTFDISEGAWMYSPRYRRPVNLPRPIRGDLTVAEYGDFFAHLPVAGASHDEQMARWRGVLRWGEADPRRWTLYPAALALCAAERMVGDITRWRERCEP
ncbi:MAG: hypothetical protein K0S86_3647 [Geminicoccaceae bacterium]|nr:hypothetical protein [Geminicoccaceae bacterium]